MKHVIVQFLKFSIVGFLSFLIDGGIYTALTTLFGTKYFLLFSIFSFSVSVIFNYICSMRFVFKGRENLSRTAEMTIFVILSVIGLGINSAVMWLLVDLMNLESVLNGILSGLMSDKLVLAVSSLSAKIIATMVVMIWNFVSRKIFLEEKDAGTKSSSDMADKQDV